MFKIYSQDSFCFPGCLPEGGGPDSNGDTFDSKDEAIADAASVLESIFDDELKVNGDSRTVRAVFKVCESELLKTGETSCDLPYRDEETGEESPDGTRFISFAIVEVVDGKERD